MGLSTCITYFFTFARVTSKIVQIVFLVVSKPRAAAAIVFHEHARAAVTMNVAMMMTMTMTVTMTVTVVRVWPKSQIVQVGNRGAITRDRGSSCKTRCKTHMAAHGIVATKRFPAMRAQIGLLSRVNASMSLQVMVASKGQITVWTHVGLLARVNAIVGPQIEVARKALGTSLPGAKIADRGHRWPVGIARIRVCGADCLDARRKAKPRSILEQVILILSIAVSLILFTAVQLA